MIFGRKGLNFGKCGTFCQKMVNTLSVKFEAFLRRFLARKIKKFLAGGRYKNSAGTPRRVVRPCFPPGALRSPSLAAVGPPGVIVLVTICLYYNSSGDFSGPLAALLRAF